MTFNNHIKGDVFNEKYPVTIQTRTHKCKQYISYLKTGFNRICKDYWCSKSITYDISFHIKSQTKVIQNSFHRTVFICLFFKLKIT